MLLMHNANLILTILFTNFLIISVLLYFFISKLLVYFYTHLIILYFILIYRLLPILFNAFNNIFLPISDKLWVAGYYDGDDSDYIWCPSYSHLLITLLYLPSLILLPISGFEAMPIYALFISIWGVYVTEYWKRREFMVCSIISSFTYYITSEYSGFISVLHKWIYLYYMFVPHNILFFLFLWRY